MEQAKDIDEMLVVPVMRGIRYASGKIGLTQKFIEGLAAYASLWQGRVTVLLREAVQADSNLGQESVWPQEMPFGIEWMPTNEEGMAGRLVGAKLILATLDKSLLGMFAAARQQGIPVVWITETTRKTRCQIIDAEARGYLRRLKRRFEAHMLELLFTNAISNAAGVQCNGTPTYQAYGGLNPRCMLFFDSRIAEHMVATDAELSVRTQKLLAGAPLRLGFSGRLIAIKGVDHLPKVAEELRRSGVEFTFDIFGGGEMEAELRTIIDKLGLNDSVRLRGIKNFESELVPTIKNEIDLFVCCHPQGDPSCTYLETMSCGTPIAGYDNEAWRGLADMARTGWVTPMGKPAELAETIALLHADRPALVRAAYAARDFSRAHDFDSTMRARIDHLHACAVTARQM